MEIILQAAFVCFTLLFAHFEIPIVKAFRAYVAINNPYNASFKKRGVVLVSFVSAILIGVYCLQTANYWKAACFIPLFIAWYKILFDGYIGAAIYKDFFYLGTTSKQDRWLTNVFSFTGPGEAKVIICAVVVIGVNVGWWLV